MLLHVCGGLKKKKGEKTPNSRLSLLGLSSVRTGWRDGGTARQALLFFFFFFSSLVTYPCLYLCVCQYVRLSVSHFYPSREQTSGSKIRHVTPRFPHAFCLAILFSFSWLPVLKTADPHARSHFPPPKWPPPNGTDREIHPSPLHQRRRYPPRPGDPREGSSPQRTPSLVHYVTRGKGGLRWTMIDGP
ncbi:hypothetical protein LZ32DRAFT_134204 [Colletotrichum eremochloae]|nr:hypothetical protein LZ32DRAFT_134204 [Colletotrichum eremochloae]